MALFNAYLKVSGVTVKESYNYMLKPLGKAYDNILQIMKYLLAVLMTEKGTKSLLREAKYTNIAGRLPENSRDRR